jgi:SAM-dependent methyltransferase
MPRMSNDSGTNKKLKESWRHWTADHAKEFLRTGPEGKRHLSRQTTLRLLDGMSSVLDVGCGTGVMFELIRDRQRELDYLGIDVTETFLDVARNLYPEDRQRFRRMSLYELPKLRRATRASDPSAPGPQRLTISMRRSTQCYLSSHSSVRFMLRQSRGRPPNRN